MRQGKFWLCPNVLRLVDANAQAAQLYLQAPRPGLATSPHRHIAPCESGDQNYCEGPNSWLATYNGPMAPVKMAPTGDNMYQRDNTFGGYSNVLVGNEEFVLKMPSALRPEVAAPILCAGATTYSPLKHWGVKAGQKVDVIDLGGLGHMAAKLAKAMGAEGTVFTTTDKRLKKPSAWV